MAGLTLYEIDDRIREIIETHVDMKTGEISEEGLAELDALDIKREAKLFGYAHYVKEQEGLVEAVEKEMARLGGRQKAILNHILFLKNKIGEAVEKGTEMVEGTRRIGWRRSTRTEFTVPEDEIPKRYKKHKPATDTAQVSLVKDDLAAGKPAAVKCAKSTRHWKLFID
ncbi:hypothetical protein LCGC14_1401950 [marine sediment metagenome]|uniref:Siphovirus Gp157 n=1 Tax=marine sediment metagenome TaxID=412755 RepID=A0A0F9MYF4_9ZZZZ